MILDVSWRMLAAASCLILLPGITLVRAPWPTVPAFSIAFWILSWSLAPAAGSGRLRFVGVSSLVFLVLGALRALQPRLWSAPTLPALFAIATALMALVPWLMVPAPTAPDLSFDSAATRLIVWRDGIPASFEPLIPGQPFVTDALGFQLLAADMSGLGGMAPHRAAFMVHRAGTGLLVMSLVYALVRLWAVDPRNAVLGSMLAVVLLEAARPFLRLHGSTDLQAALATFAAALLVHRTTRSATVAGSFFAAAAVAVAPAILLGFIAALVAGALVLVARLSAALGATAGRRGFAPVAACLLVVYGGLAFVRPRPAFSEHFIDAAAWAQAHVSPMDMICSDEGSDARWLPAVAGRAVSHPPQPWSVSTALVPTGRSCRLSYADVLGARPSH